MRKKWILIVGVLLLVGLFAWTGSARAGGWATLTLSELPTEVVAERPFTIEFSVRQHGQTLLSGLDAEVTAVHEASGDRVVVQAKDTAERGFYTAELTLPEAGAWRWQINAFGMDYPMPSLTVSAAVPASEPVAADGETTVAWQLVLGWVAAAGAILLLISWTQQRSRPRLAGGALLALVSLTGFILYAQMPQPVLAETEATAATVPAIAPEAMGEALFVAKGCIQCHTNDNVTMTRNMFQIGPNITFVKRPPEYLQTWLKDPSSLKADTQMPDLQLSQAEIDILIAFVQQD